MTIRSIYTPEAILHTDILYTTFLFYIVYKLHTILHLRLFYILRMPRNKSSYTLYAQSIIYNTIF